MASRKLVRAIKTGFWEGHRRRKGAEFTVPASAKEAWFVEIGPAPAGDEPAAQLKDARGPQKRTFLGAMDVIAAKEAGEVAKLSTPVIIPVAEVEAPPATPDVTTGSDADSLT